MARYSEEEDRPRRDEFGRHERPHHRGDDHRRRRREDDYPDDRRRSSREEGYEKGGGGGGDDYYYGPAQDAPDPLPPGTVVRGTVARIEPYGAFLDFEHGEEKERGLIHISQLASHRVEQVTDIIPKTGTKLYAVILEAEIAVGGGRAPCCWARF